MNFFDLSTELRLQIYSELLVHLEPIVLVTDSSPPSPPLFRSKSDGLCPALLRVNKRTHSEASSLLYSNNRFQFPEIFTSIWPIPDSAHIAPFLSQIGSQASLIRHICIDFPTFDDYRRGRARLYEAHIKNLELIRDVCTGITTLELSLNNHFRLECANDTLDGPPIAAEALDLLDTRFKAILSLKKIIVNVHMYDDDDLSDDLMKKMRDCGWTVEVTKLEIPKACRIYDEDEFKFDFEEDYVEYMNRKDFLDLQSEKEWWREECYRMRRDSYRENDSDYD